MRFRFVLKTASTVLLCLFSNFYASMLLLTNCFKHYISISAYSLLKLKALEYV